MKFVFLFDRIFSRKESISGSSSKIQYPSERTHQIYVLFVHKKNIIDKNKNSI